MTDFNRRTEIEDKLTSLEERISSLQERLNRYYESGWNAALELAAFEIEHNFVKAFGKDTLSSIAIYIRGMKK